MQKLRKVIVLSFLEYVTSLYDYIFVFLLVWGYLQQCSGLTSASARRDHSHMWCRGSNPDQAHVRTQSGCRKMRRKGKLGKVKIHLLAQGYAWKLLSMILNLGKGTLSELRWNTHFTVSLAHMNFPLLMHLLSVLRNISHYFDRKKRQSLSYIKLVVKFIEQRMYC